MSIKGTEQKLREAFDLVAVALSEAGYPERVKDAYELLGVNECAVALENMRENLYECECSVPLRAYQLFAEAGAELKVKNRYWEMLGSQVMV
jgi:hypothetical protein